MGSESNGKCGTNRSTGRCCLLGWIWFGMLVLLAGGYYAAYLYKLRGAPATGRGGGLWRKSGET